MYYKVSNVQFVIISLLLAGIMTVLSSIIGVPANAAITAATASFLGPVAPILGWISGLIVGGIFSTIILLLPDYIYGFKYNQNIKLKSRIAASNKKKIFQSVTGIFIKVFNELIMLTSKRDIKIKEMDNLEY